VTELKQAEEEHERLHRLQTDLGHINRMTMLGELTASLAREVSQPTAATLTNAKACLRWIAHERPRRSIIESQGGRLWAADSASGAAFLLTLPATVEALP
jgi:hypothetical protein